MAEKKKKGRWQYFSMEGDKLERKKSPCPRCGSGTYLAEHKDRLACGKCGYTEFKNSKNDSQSK